MLAPTPVEKKSFLDLFFASDAYQQAEMIAFDYDGVVGHTEPLQMLAFKATAEQYSPIEGLDIDFDEMAREMIGKPEAVILGILKERHQIPESVEFLLAKREENYLNAVVSDLQPNPHALQILERANEDGKHVFILSNGRSTVLGPINDHWGIGHHFARMKTVDARRIPDKVEYLLSNGAKHGLRPDQILILEDSRGTVENAEKAGIHAAYFCHSLSPSPDFVPQSGLVIPCVNPMDSMRAPAAARIITANFRQQVRGEHAEIKG